MNQSSSTTQLILDIILRHYPGAQGVYLFGTHGTTDERPDSDVDIALLLPPAEAARETRLDWSPCRFELEQALKRPVDLCNARQVSAVLQMQFIFHGTLIHSADRYAVDEFEMLAMSYYQKLNEERRDILDEFERTGRAWNI